MGKNWFKEVRIFSMTYNDGDDVWFVGEFFSLLFRMSIKDNQIKQIIRIKDEQFETFRKYWRLIRLGSKLFLIPHSSDRITVFHIDQNIFSFINLEKTMSNCLSCVKVDKNLYLISDTEIIIVDFENEKIIEYISIPPYGKLVSEVALLLNGHIIIPLIFQPGVIDFCIAEKSFCYIQLGGKISGFVTGVADGMDIWLAGDKGNIVKWNYETKQMIFYDDYPDSFETYNYDEKGNFIPWELGWTQGVSFQYWYECALLRDTVWFLPLHSNSLLFIEKKSRTLKKYTFENEEETEQTVKCHGYAKFLLVGFYKNRFLKIYSTKRDVIYNIDVVKLEHNEEFIDINNINLNLIKNEYLGCIEKKAAQHGINESSNISVLDMIEFLKEKTTKTTEQISYQIGTSVHKTIKGSMMDINSKKEDVRCGKLQN